MFENLPDGKIEKDSVLFEELQAAAKIKFDKLSNITGKRLRQKLKRHMAWLALNDELTPFGWAIRRNGKMYEFNMVNWNRPPIETPQAPHGSVEDVNHRALQHFTNTGKLVDPRDGKQLPISERHRFGIS